MCQKFLPKIKNGDKRVFIINGKVCGAISRVPKKGSFLSNMSKGAKPVSINLTRNEKKISNICLLYTSPSPRDRQKSRMPSSA